MIDALSKNITTMCVKTPALAQEWAVWSRTT